MTITLDTSRRRFDSCFPEELTDLDQWCLHNGDKEPLQVSCLSPKYRRGARAGDPETWHGFIHARLAAYRDDLGLGFQLSEDDPYVVLDLDHVRDPDTGEVVAPWADKILSRFSETLTCTSISGSGFHIWCRTTTGLPGPGVQCKLPGNTGIDIYDRKHYFAMSGNIFVNAPIREYTADALDVYQWARKKNESRKRQAQKKRQARQGRGAGGKRRGRRGFRSGRNPSGEVTPDDWLTRRGIPFTIINRGDGVIRYGLDECPWEGGHTTKSKPGDAVVYANSYDAFCFGCFHTHCSTYTWDDFKERVTRPR